MHFPLSYDFVNVDIFWDSFLLRRGILAFFGFFSCFFAEWLQHPIWFIRIEEIMCDSLALLQDLIDHIVVVLASVSELDMWYGRGVDVGGVVVVFFYLISWTAYSTYINCRRFSEFLKVIYQVLEFIREISRWIYSISERSQFILFAMLFKFLFLLNLHFFF